MNPAGLKKNKIIDLIALALVAAILGLTPLIAGAMVTIPEKGPIYNPSILIILLTFLGLILAASLAIIGGMFMRRVKSVKSDQEFTPLGLNMFNVLSKFLAGLFLISGFVKLQDPIGFGYKLDDYWVFFANQASFFPSEMMQLFSNPISAFVSVFEVALGIALLTGFRMRQTSWFLLLMMLFFTFLTGLAAFTGELQDCGCFGDALKLEPWQTFLKDILLMIPGILIFMNRKRIHPYYRNPLPGFATYGSFVLMAGLSYYCYQHLELMDFRGAYKVGQDICYNAVNPGEDGLMIAHDFTPFGRDRMPKSHDDCEGPVLYIVMYDMQVHPKAHYDEAAETAKEIAQNAPGIFIAGGTNAGSGARKKMDLHFAEDFCWSPQDQKALRTMIRSSPGYILLQDGVVIKKWHHNDRPNAQMLIDIVGGAATVAPAVAPAPEVIVPDSADADAVPSEAIGDEG